MEEISAPTPKRRSKSVSTIAWIVTAVLGVVCTFWITGRWVFWFDIAASQQAMISAVATFVTLSVLIARRWRAGLLCLVLVLVSLYPLVVDRVWSLPGIDLEHKPVDAVRVVSFNIYPKNEQWREDIETLMSLDADVIVLLEVSPELNRAIRKYELLKDTQYSQWAHRRWVDQETSPGFILSQWPIERIDTASDAKAAQHELFVRVTTDAGEFVVGLTHPLSPRNAQRWAQGNAVIRSQAQTIKRLTETLDVPLVVGADLNAAPAQLRARSLRHAGLRMSKPVLRIGGSFPAGSDVPALFQIQLDDLWSAGAIVPIAWDTIEFAGSDHKAVVADFMIGDGSGS
jgi:endonuclease/exonuclease/phosphatase (EEP) superfamily protein YafD